VEWPPPVVAPPEEVIDCRIGDMWSLCTRLPATLAALEVGRITLAKARVIDAETMNLSDERSATG
jgi:hypothetical protein